MNCPSCNTPNREGAKRCRNCGSVLSQSAAPPYAPQPQQPLPPPHPQPAPQYQPQPPQAQQPLPPAQAAKRGGKAMPWRTIGIGCLLLFIGFLFGIAALLLVQAVNPSGATASPTVTAVATALTPAAATVTTPVVAAPTATPTPARPDKGAKAPTFTLKDTTGADKELNGLINGKFAVLVFWATGVPMTDTLPALKKFVDDNHGVVIGINSDDAVGKINKYVTDNGLSKFTMLLDGDGKIKEQYKITETPTYLLIGKDGTITERLGAAAKRDVLEAKLGELK